MTAHHIVLGQATTTKHVASARMHMWQCADCDRATRVSAVSSERAVVSLAADRHSYATGHAVRVVTMTHKVETYTPCGHEQARS